MKTPLSSMLLVLVASFFGSIGAGFPEGRSSEAPRRVALPVPEFQAGAGRGFLPRIVGALRARNQAGQLSVLYPLVSLSYIWALVWARVFFNEKFTTRKLAGLCLILLGILFVGLGNR